MIVVLFMAFVSIIHADSISLIEGNAEGIGTAIVETASLRVRSGPGTNFSILSGIRKGDKLPVFNQSKEWFQSQTKYGRKGWVLGKFVTFISSVLNMNDERISTMKPKTYFQNLIEQEALNIKYFKFIKIGIFFIGIKKKYVIILFLRQFR